MTTFEIKVIAIITMVIDHIGLFFFPHVLFLRVVGRLAFPLFAWLIANGAYHTSSINAYLKRLFVFALISQLPYFLANRLVDHSFWQLNVLFTLFLGLLAIKVVKEQRNRLLSGFTILLCAIAANVFSASFGAAGVLSIVAFFLFFNNRKSMIISQIVLLGILPLAAFMYSLSQRTITSFYYVNSHIYVNSYIQPFCLFSLLFITLYHGKQGRKMKYLFYYFYPLQYVVFFCLKLLPFNF